MNLGADLVDKISNYEIEVHKGDSDLVVSSGNKIKIYSPSSVTKFIYNILYSAISSVLEGDHKKDVLSLGLFYMCKNYVYEDYTDLKTNGPPVLINADKLLVPSTIIREIIEPLVGKINKKYLFFFPCNDVDSCKIINNYEELFRMYNIDRNIIPYGDYPIILVNCKISNIFSLEG